MVGDTVPQILDMNDPTRKKLSFRAWHRGTREADLLMGRFAEHFLPTASEDDVGLFGELLAENDPDIFDWLTGKEAMPDRSFTPLLVRMQEFYKTVS